MFYTIIFFFFSIVTFEFFIYLKWIILLELACLVQPNKKSDRGSDHCRNRICNSSNPIVELITSQNYIKKPVPPFRKSDMLVSNAENRQSITPPRELTNCYQSLLCKKRPKGLFCVASFINGN